MGRANVVSTATRYGLDGPRLESQWVRGILHQCRPPLVSTQPPAEWIPGIFTGEGIKRPGRGVNDPPRLAQRLKKE